MFIRSAAFVSHDSGDICVRENPSDNTVYTSALLTGATLWRGKLRMFPANALQDVSSGNA